MPPTEAAAAAFRLAEQKAAAGLGLQLTERFVPIGTPVGSARLIEAGFGPPVLLVHGGGSNANAWLPLMAQLGGYRMIAVDRPGCGLTSGFIYTRAEDLRAHAVTFLDKVAEAAGLGPVDIIANSMGALWSLWLAIDHPSRVRSLALLGCPACVVGTSAPFAMRLLSRPGLSHLLERPATGQTMRHTLRMLGHPDDLLDRMPPELLDVSVAGANLPGAASSFRSLLWRVLRLRGARPDCALGAEELRALSTRPLVVWGKHDPFGDHDAARHLAAATGADLAFAGTGHLPWLDDPEHIATLIRHHLDKSPRPVDRT
jgi:pimeloyl-ACP methyl ester carboxylesterase